MNDVIEHLEDPKSALRQIRRVLKNDGALYLTQCSFHCAPGTGWISRVSFE